MSSFELTLPSTKATKSIKPPLKKSEIIYALAMRKSQQLQAAATDYETRLAKLSARIEEHVAKLTFEGAQRSSRWNTKHLRNYRKPGCKYWPSINVRTGLQLELNRTILLEDMPADLRKLVKEHNDLMSKVEGFLVPDFNDIKREIRDQLTGSTTEPAQRVKALLNDPATVKAIDKALSALAKPAHPAAPAIAA